MCNVKRFHISLNYPVGRPSVDYKKATLMTVWYLSNTETFRYLMNLSMLYFGTINQFMNYVSQG